MNLVENILNGLSGSQSRELGSQVGLDAGQTQDAIGAAVPALLAAIAGKASSSDGSQKLASALGRLDPSFAGNPLAAIDNPAAAGKGSDLLSSLLGGSTLQGLAGTIGRYLGLDASLINKFLGYLSPVIMGYIAKQFIGKAISPQGLTSFFADQKNNIARAMPSGLSLADVPGVPNLTAASRQVAATAQNAGNNALKWVVPVVLLAAIALGALYMAGVFNRPQNPQPERHTVLRPPVDEANGEIPDAKKLGEDLTSIYTSTTQTLAGIKDAATAEAALPKLKEMNTKLDAFTALFNKLPATARSTITAITGTHFDTLKNTINRALAIPGVKEKIEPVVMQISDKLSKFGAGT